MAIVQYQVPKKLTAGTPVVVYIKPQLTVTAENVMAGLRVGLWFKTTFKFETANVYCLQLVGRSILVLKEHAIVVRSTSWADSSRKARVDKVNPVRNPKRNRAKVK